LVVTVVLGLVSLACTSHASEPDADAQPEPTPELAPEPSTVSPAAPAVADPPPSADPITLLQYKPFVAAIGQLTGDEHPDVLALCHAPEGATLLLMRGERDGTFIEAATQLTEGSGLALGDLDADGHLDALLLDAHGPPAYRFARNDGAGNFSIGPKRRIPGRHGGELRGASIADLDGDGDLDAIVPLWDELRVLLGDGTGNFTPGSRLASGRDPFATALADVDRDGHLDLAVTSGAGPATNPDHYDSAGASAWIYRGGARGFADPVRVAIPGAHELAFSDLDADGRPELVVSGSSALTVIRDPLGEAQATRTLVANDGTLLIADVLDPPGPDLITTSYIQGRVHVLTGYPKLDKTSIEAGSYVVAMFAADLVRDGGRPEIILLDAGPPTGPHEPIRSAIEVLFPSALSK
jgi:hypothetical protein